MVFGVPCFSVNLPNFDDLFVCHNFMDDIHHQLGAVFHHCQHPAQEREIPSTRQLSDPFVLLPVLFQCQVAKLTEESGLVNNLTPHTVPILRSNGNGATQFRLPPPSCQLLKVSDLLLK